MVIRSTDAVARLPAGTCSFLVYVAFANVPDDRSSKRLLRTSRDLLEIPAFRGRKDEPPRYCRASLPDSSSEALEGFQRGGESVTADVRKGRKEETLCVISIVDIRESESIRLVCFGTQNKTTGGLETFQITERTRYWETALAREHLGLVIRASI